MAIKKIYTIGRSPDNDIVLHDDTVSRKHAELVIRDDSISINDFGSKNGTYIVRNGYHVPIKIVEVSDSDTIAFGSALITVRELLRLAEKAHGSKNMIPIPVVEPPIPKYQEQYQPQIEADRQAHNLEYAGFWIRVGASLVDGILFIIVTWPLLILVYGVNYFDIKDEKFFAGFADFILTWVFPVVVTILFWVKKQATPGKMALSVKIVDAKTGGIPSLWQCVGRYFAYFLSTLPLCLGFIWIAFDSKKQGWHDKLAGTLVVKYNKKKPVRFE